jgi:hypothetical protein
MNDTGLLASQYNSPSTQNNIFYGSLDIDNGA